jgi:hypothetical protein
MKLITIIDDNWEIIIDEETGEVLSRSRLISEDEDPELYDE